MKAWWTTFNVAPNVNLNMLLNHAFKTEGVNAIEKGKEMKEF
jgi:hypothetical protein